MTESSQATAAEASQPEASQSVKCDFCGDLVASVRRVALDGSYDRLQKAHHVQYACPVCSERKERQRLGFDR